MKTKRVHINRDFLIFSPIFIETENKVIVYQTYFNNIPVDVEDTEILKIERK